MLLPHLYRYPAACLPQAGRFFHLPSHTEKWFITYFFRALIDIIGQ